MSENCSIPQTGHKISILQKMNIHCRMFLATSILEDLLVKSVLNWWVLRLRSDLTDADSQIIQYSIISIWSFSKAEVWLLYIGQLLARFLYQGREGSVYKVAPYNVYNSTHSKQKHQSTWPASAFCLLVSMFILLYNYLIFFIIQRKSCTLMTQKV